MKNMVLKNLSRIKTLMKKMFPMMRMRNQMKEQAIPQPKIFVTWLGSYGLLLKLVIG